MNGAEALLESARQGGVELCFANPGTTEMPLVAALERARMRAVLALFEGVCTGAADGYGRMAERPAATLGDPRAGPDRTRCGPDGGRRAPRSASIRSRRAASAAGRARALR